MNLAKRDWLPMKWPCGPLEIARRNKSGSIDAGVKETLEAWVRPSALDLLKDTPINCLVVDWADGGPEDSAQQQALKPLLEAGRKWGISFVGKLALKEGVSAAVSAARAAGLSTVMLDAASGQSLDLPAIRQFPRDKAAWEAASTPFSVAENVWPGLNLQTMNGDTALAGPTGIPWVNSNAWFSLLASELAPGKTLWLDLDPPAASNLLHPADYALAVADSCAYGSQWIISLDDKLRAALPKGNSQAQGVWKSLCEAVAFFENHKGWQAFRSQGILAVISDFRGDNAYMSGEVLNLLNRRQVQFRIIDRVTMGLRPTQGNENQRRHPREGGDPSFAPNTMDSRFRGNDESIGRAKSPPLLEGLKAVLWLDPEKPSSEQRAQLLAFVQHGGLVITAAYWGTSDVTPTKKDPSLRYRLYNIGQGQIAVADEIFQDPYQVAVDAHLLVSRRNDLVRLYNPGTTNCRLSDGFVSPYRGKRLVQVLNYSSEPASYVTLWVNGKVESARLWQLGAAEARTLQGRSASRGTEFDLPPVSVYCALEFEGTNL